MQRPVADELRVLVFAPLGRDGRLVCQLLARSGISAVECADAACLARAIEEGAGALVMTEEAVTPETYSWLAKSLERQSPWLDMPMLLFGSASASEEQRRRLSLLEQLGNVTILERPIRTTALAGNVRAALRSRRRQQRLKLIADMSASLVAVNEPQRLLADVWQVLQRHIDLDVYLYHEVQPDGFLRLEAWTGIAERSRANLNTLRLEKTYYAQQNSWGRALGRGHRPLEQLLAESGVTVSDCRVLRVGDEPLGLLTFAATRRAKFTPDEEALLRTVCDHVGLALQRSRMIDQLRQRAAELEEHAQRKDEFLAMLGHELRNPLAAIITGMLALRRLGDSHPSREPVLDAVERQSHHMARLVDDLLDVSRISRGKIELHKAYLDINPTVREAVELVAPLIAERRHRLDMRLAPVPLFIEADETRIRQVVENLLTNAAKYTDPGGFITISTAPLDGHLEICVRDNGIGLSREMLVHVFDMFAQERRTLDRSQGGLGIGLTVVKNLVEMHGGRVEASSQGIGHGSEFRVMLPLAKNSPVAEEPVAPDEPLRSGLRILVVEDRPEVGEMTRLLIETFGYQAECVYRGRQALERCSEFRPHLVLLDIGLPEMDGYQVAHRLRQQLGDDCPFLVALTGYGTEQDRRHALEAGFDRHCAKPLHADALRELFTEVEDRLQPDA